jgi:hypothetical protein
MNKFPSLQQMCFYSISKLLDDTKPEELQKRVEKEYYINIDITNYEKPRFCYICGNVTPGIFYYTVKCHCEWHDYGYLKEQICSNKCLQLYGDHYFNNRFRAIKKQIPFKINKLI